MAKFASLNNFFILPTYRSVASIVTPRLSSVQKLAKVPPSSRASTVIVWIFDSVLMAHNGGCAERYGGAGTGTSSFDYKICVMNIPRWTVFYL